MMMMLIKHEKLAVFREFPAPWQVGCQEYLFQMKFILK